MSPEYEVLEALPSLWDRSNVGPSWMSAQLVTSCACINHLWKQGVAPAAWIRSSSSRQHKAGPKPEPLSATTA